MKKILSLFLIFIIVFNISACGTITQTDVITNPATDTTYATAMPEINESAIIPENSTFAVHFIDVGQGDAALVLCDGKSMLIDGGRPKASDVIYTYLKNQGINCLDYIICTHPDEDQSQSITCMHPILKLIQNHIKVSSKKQRSRA